MCSDAQSSTLTSYLNNKVEVNPVTNVAVDTAPLGSALKDALTGSATITADALKQSAAINATAVVAVTEAVTKSQAQALDAITKRVDQGGRAALLLGIATLAVMLYPKQVKKVLG